MGHTSAGLENKINILQILNVFESKYFTNIKGWQINDHTALFSAHLTLNSNPESCSTVEECEKVIKLVMMTVKHGQDHVDGYH